MKDYSIEYAHIYTNSKIDDEHSLSLKVLSNLKEELRDKSLSLVVMVDDYSFPDPTFDYTEFSAWLTEHDNHPDIIFRESQLIPLCDQVLSFMQTTTLRESIEEYIRQKKYPCSLFIAAWYLLRLGKLQHAGFPNDLQAKHLINILPDSFKPFEDKGLEIIQDTEFKDLVSSIENRYIQGRLIA